MGAEFNCKRRRSYGGVVERQKPKQAPLQHACWLKRQISPTARQQIGVAAKGALLQVPTWQQPPVPPGWQGALSAMVQTGGFVGHGTFGGATGAFGSEATLVMRPDMARLRRVIESGAWKCITKTRRSRSSRLVAGDEGAARICAI